MTLTPISIARCTTFTASSTVAGPNISPIEPVPRAMGATSSPVSPSGCVCMESGLLVQGIFDDQFDGPPRSIALNAVHAPPRYPPTRRKLGELERHIGFRVADLVRLLAAGIVAGDHRVVGGSQAQTVEGEVCAALRRNREVAMGIRWRCVISACRLQLRRVRHRCSDTGECRWTEGQPDRVGDSDRL